jgi:hypothetical protein
MQAPRATNTAVPSPGTMQFYVHSPDFQPDEPMSAEHIARGIAAGTIPESVLVAPVGAQTWSAIDTASEIVEALRVARSMRSGFPSRQPRASSSPPISRIGAATPVSAPVVAPVVVPAAAAPAEPAIAQPAPGVAPATPTTPGPVADSAAAAKPDDKKDDKKDEKKEDKKPVLDPRYKRLPLQIFLGCCAVGLVETVIALLVH